MLHAVRGEHGNVARIEVDRHGDDHGPLRIPQPLCHARRDFGVLEGLFVLRECCPPERGIPLERRRFFDRSHGRGV